MKKRVLAFLLAGMMVLASGCGSKSMMATENAVAESSAAMDTAYAGSQYEEADYEEDAMDSGSGITSENGLESTVDNGRKLIRTIYLSLQTTEFDPVLSDLSAKTTELGGYIENSSVSGNSYYYQNTRYAATPSGFRQISWISL